MSASDPHPDPGYSPCRFIFSCKWKATWARVSAESERNMHRSSQSYPRISRFCESSDQGYLRELLKYYK